jgi:predicted signal transduction protein with EAL and GGDEF domain
MTTPDAQTPHDPAPGAGATAPADAPAAPPSAWDGAPVSQIDLLLDTSSAPAIFEGTDLPPPRAEGQLHVLLAGAAATRPTLQAALATHTRLVLHPHADAAAALAALADTPVDLAVVDLCPGEGPADAVDALLQALHQVSSELPVPVVGMTPAGEAGAVCARTGLQRSVCALLPVDADERTVCALLQNLSPFAQAKAAVLVDRVTGLPNRNGFLKHLQWALSQARRFGTIGAVLHLGLDRFQRVNEVLRTDQGDQMLRLIGQRLDQALRDSDLLAHVRPDATAGNPDPALSRVGGDEFSVLLPQVPSAAKAEVVARRLCALLAQPVRLGGHEFVMSASVGISIYPHDGTSAESLLHAAGVAMRHAKRLGRGHCQYYASELNARSLLRLGLEERLRRAIEANSQPQRPEASDELLLHFQPQFDLQTGRITGAEALLRWRTAERGLISPGEFIPVAEESGLIIPLGQWVRQAVCRHVRRWTDAGLSVPRIAFNASALELRDAQFMPSLQQALRDHSLSGDALTLEITESAAMSFGRDALRVMRVVNQAGLKTSLDDFGTGHSSLSYLPQMQLGELKIDRSFLADIGAGSDNALIVRAIIGLGHSLKLKVVAEGVETERQLHFLRDNGCDQVQGFLLARPMDAETFGELLARLPAQATTGAPGTLPG